MPFDKSDQVLEKVQTFLEVVQCDSQKWHDRQNHYCVNLKW